MTIATSDNCSEHATHEFTTEASTLGIGPGAWPTAIWTTLGNSQPFIYQRTEYDGGGDVVAVHYTQALGCSTLTLFND